MARNQSSQLTWCECSLPYCARIAVDSSRPGRCICNGSCHSFANSGLGTSSIFGPAFYRWVFPPYHSNSLPPPHSERLLLGQKSKKFPGLCFTHNTRCSLGRRSNSFQLLNRPQNKSAPPTVPLTLCQSPLVSVNHQQSTNIRVPSPLYRPPLPLAMMLRCCTPYHTNKYPSLSYFSLHRTSHTALLFLLPFETMHQYLRFTPTPCTTTAAPNSISRAFSTKKFIMPQLSFTTVAVTPSLIVLILQDAMR